MWYRYGDRETKIQADTERRTFSNRSEIDRRKERQTTTLADEQRHTYTEAEREKEKEKKKQRERGGELRHK